MKSGIEIITEERKRQIDVKKYDTKHDSDETAFELSTAAGCFIANALNKEFKNYTHYDDKGPVARFQLRQVNTRRWKEEWPWSDHDGREKADIITSLAKAGALCAAEIDRIQKSDL